MGSFDDEGRVCIMPTYLNALWGEGAIGILLPYRTDPDFLREVASQFDGFLFCGGVDADPALYGEENLGLSKNICSLRDGFEMAMYKEIFSCGKPILGICRGMQMMNIRRGGSMHQDIDNHSQTTDKTECPQKTLINDGLLKEIVGKSEIMTNTYHHQCVKALGEGLVVDAVSEDGYIEAIHLDGHRFCLGVQWHPEYCYGIDEPSTKIFEAFVKACKENA